MKYKTKDKDYTRCNPDIAKALKNGKIILCECSNKDGASSTYYIYEYLNGEPSPYVTKYNYYEKAIPIPIKQKVLSIDRLLKVLAKNRYSLTNGGCFNCPGSKPIFDSAMFEFCGKEPGGSWVWEDEWLEEIECDVTSEKSNHKTPLQRQIATASNELDRLSGMLDDEMKRKDVLDMCDILADWEVE